MALSKCWGDKASGPDGFNFSLIHTAWDIIKEDFCAMLSEFHKQRKLSKEANATFLAFIPKCLIQWS